MYIYLYICIYTYIYVYIHTYIYTYTYYNCMRSMSSVISAHNCSTLNPPKTSFGCNY